MRQLERRVLLSVIDRRWREHLYEMDYLKEGIGLRAMAQRDPVIEYAREGFLMYNDMVAGIKEDVVGYLFNLDVKVQQAPSKGQVPEQVAKLVREAAAQAKAVPGGAKAGSGATNQASDSEGIEIAAKGLGEGPKVEDFSYSSAEGEAATERPLSRAERRRKKREERKRTKNN